MGIEPVHMGYAAMFGLAGLLLQFPVLAALRSHDLCIVVNCSAVGDIGVVCRYIKSIFSILDMFGLV